MRIVLMGPQGSGKGTQAKGIVDKYGLPHISMGDLLRDNVRRKTELGIEAEGYMNQGKLVPNELTIRLLQERLSDKDCSSGFILDGFPRNREQAEALDRITEIDAAVEIFISDDTAVKRIAGRRSCPSCGEVYHVENKPPKEEGVCDRCGTALVQREDDKPEAIRTRLEIYHSQTEPLIDFYEDKGVFHKINGDQEIGAVFLDLKQILEN